jgi:hypothetical protein
LIIKKRMLEGLDLGAMPDAPDGSRLAITNSSQTFTGEKWLLDGGRGLADTSKQPTTLIIKSEADDAFTDFPVDRIEHITLSAGNISGRSFTLAKAVPADLEMAVSFQFEGSDWFYPKVRFDVSGDTVSWGNYPYTIDKLKTGDVLYVHYVA